MQTSTAVRNISQRNSRYLPSTETPQSAHLLIGLWVIVMALLSMLIVLV
ncbi:hypothetical protein [Nocardia donostiensis]|nr:hypothetical protein [Nocardia donostiensis]